MKQNTLLLLILCIMGACKSPTRTETATVIEKCNIKIQDGHFTPELLHLFGKVSDAQISPDGSKILYGVSYTDIEQNKGMRQLFTMNIDGSDNKRITSMPISSSNARWLNDNKSIVFMQTGQIYTMNIDGSGYKQISEIAGGIDAFELSPDQKNIMYIAQIQSATKPTDLHKDLPKSTGRIITNLMYRHWDHFVETIPHTFITNFNLTEIVAGKDILNGAPYELPTLPFGGLEQLSWSPDSKYIAYSCRKVTGREYAFSTNTDIYLYNVENGTEENLTKGMLGYDKYPTFSPDGKYLAWTSMERAGFEADKERIFIINLETKEKKELTTEFKYNASDIKWNKTSNSLYFSSLVNAIQGIFETDLQGNIKRITSDKAWFDFSNINDAGDKLIATYTSMDMPTEIVAVSKSDGSYTQLTHENAYLLSQLKVGKTEERWITTTDNKKMHTWVLYPPEFDASKKYPAILFCTGGPQGTLSQSFSTRWNFRLMAAQGYIVILPNRRGTTAFGQEWCDQISGDYCGQNMQDYLSAARELKKEPYVGKMGAAGASYGGYSIYYLAGIHNGMFDAFLSHAGIFNQEQMYMMTEEMWFPHWDNGGAPWDNNPTALRHYANSAHKLLKNWDTPIMVTHGELDYRVPVEQGMAAFNAAQMIGVPSEMLLFPDENHWILKPQNAIHWQRSYFTWFDKWLK